MMELLRRIERFLGAKVIKFLVLGVVIGLSLFGVELAFAYALQAFLAAIGAIDAQTVRLSARLPHLGLYPVLGLMIVIGALRAVFNAVQIYLQGASSEHLRYRLRACLLRWAIWSESASTAEVTTVFGTRIDNAGQFVTGVQTLAVQLTSAVFLAGWIFTMAPLITLAAGAGFALTALSLLFADRRAMGAGIGMAGEIEKTISRLVLSLRNLLLLQIYGTQGREEAAAQRSLGLYHRHVLTSFWLSAVKYAVPQVFGVALICLIALASTSSHGMPPGVLVSYLYLLLRLLLMFSGINQNVTVALVSWPQTLETIRWWESHDAEHFIPSAPDRAQASAVVAAPIGWRLTGVGFRYPNEKKPVFQNLDLMVKPGQSLVVIGPSGAGKSTLLAVMLGLLKPQEGRVELVFGDVPPESLAARQNDLLRSIGYVGPESFLVEGTVRENLFYGLERDPSAAEIDDALEKAECQFARRLPRGLDHTLTEQGQGLSAGQKQRLSLARALLRRPRALILDEATSNLDLETESRLVETLSKLKHQMTLLIVTHRVTMLPLSDQRLDLNPAAQIDAKTAPPAP